MRVEPQPDEVEFNTHNIPMADSNRIVYYNRGLHNTDTTPPVLTRYHAGEWRPGVRQRIQGNPHFADWEATLYATKGPRLPVRNYKQVRGQPIRIWDASAYPASLPPQTYIPNPIQQTPNSLQMNAQTVQSSAQVWRTW